MLQSSDTAERILKEGRSLYGPGWKVVDSFEDLEDGDEYESEEEVSCTIVRNEQAEAEASGRRSMWCLIWVMLWMDCHYRLKRRINSL